MTLIPIDFIDQCDTRFFLLYSSESLVRPFTIGEKGLGTPSYAVYEVNNRTMDKTQLVQTYSHYAPLREPKTR